MRLANICLVGIALPVLVCAQDQSAYAAQTFAYRKDPVCAEALLQLLTDEQKLTLQAVDNLTGSYFGFQPGTVLGPEARKVALQKFAAWIRQNGPSRE